ncbi:hypothetical protein [Culicoidibacter larvae]|uniref:Uncharacterized protein n=1 Tax=Culicoidibacter larvae TaxID=2579976 RepID=A0A5R8QJ50_9FIRM|nr:hypothetical protein [Culicoidibacter larvae]TLG77473.1 hypothetical protein FEZ08_02295 [Culicoidibacter larvae]
MSNFISCIVMGLVMSFYSVFGLTPTIYESPEEALQSEVFELQKEDYRTGTYPVTIRYREEGKIIEKQIRVTVDGPYTVIENKIAIDANAITLSEGVVKKMTDEDWIRLTDAHAWRTDTAEELMVYVADKQQVKDEAGKYLISFGTEQGVTTTVPVTVLAGTTVAPSNQQSKINVWYEQNPTDTGLGFIGFWNDFLTVLRIGLLSMLVLPILLLLWQFFWSSRIEHHLQIFIANRRSRRKKD